MPTKKLLDAVRQGLGALPDGVNHLEQFESQYNSATADPLLDDKGVREIAAAELKKATDAWVVIHQEQLIKYVRRRYSTLRYEHLQDVPADLCFQLDGVIQRWRLEQNVWDPGTFTIGTEKWFPVRPNDSMTFDQWVWNNARKVGGQIVRQLQLQAQVVPTEPGGNLFFGPDGQRPGHRSRGPRSSDLWDQSLDNPEFELPHDDEDDDEGEDVEVAPWSFDPFRHAVNRALNDDMTVFSYDVEARNDKQREARRRVVKVAALAGSVDLFARLDKVTLEQVDNDERGEKANSSLQILARDVSAQAVRATDAGTDGIDQRVHRTVADVMFAIATALEIALAELAGDGDIAPEVRRSVSFVYHHWRFSQSVPVADLLYFVASQGIARNRARSRVTWARELKCEMTGSTRAASEARQRLQKLDALIRTAKEQGHMVSKETTVYQRATRRTLKSELRVGGFIRACATDTLKFLGDDRRTNGSDPRVKLEEARRVADGSPPSLEPDWGIGRLKDDQVPTKKLAAGALIAFAECMEELSRYDQQE